MRNLLLVLTMSGCGSSVRGEIAGESPAPIRSSLWFPVGTGDNQVISISLLSAPDGCDTFAAWYTAEADAYAAYLSDADVDALAAALTTAEQENFPSEYWGYDLTVVQDPDTEVEGEYSVADKEALVGVRHQFDYTDYEKVKKEGDDTGIHTQSYYTTEGTVEVRHFKNEGSLSGSAEFGLLDLDAADAGAVTLSLAVPYCEEAGAAYADYLAAIAGG